METQTNCCEQHKPTKHTSTCGGVSSGIYGMAFIGAVVYFIQHASSFWQGALGVLKAAVWPALLIYKALDYLKM